MKLFLLICFFFLLCFSLAEVYAQTPTSIPSPENVLVVFKIPIDANDAIGDTSELIKNYYAQQRNIPTSNILGLNGLVNADIFDPASNTTHRIEIKQDGEIISDFNVLTLASHIRRQ
jgi:hypothetical protein